MKFSTNQLLAKDILVMCISIFFYLNLYNVSVYFEFQISIISA